MKYIFKIFPTMLFSCALLILLSACISLPGSNNTAPPLASEDERTFELPTNPYKDNVAPIGFEEQDMAKIGWDSTSSCTYVSGDSYRVITPAMNQAVCLYKKATLTNFAYQVNMDLDPDNASTEIGAGNGGGLVVASDVRYMSFLSFMVYGDGTYALFAKKGDEVIDLAPSGDKKIPSFDVQQKNTLAVVNENDTYTFYVNGNEVVSTDQGVDLGGNYVGLIAESSNNTPISPLYTRAKAWGTFEATMY